MSKTIVAFLVPPYAHVLDLTGPMHIFYEARDLGAPIELRFLKAGSASEVESSAGLFFSRLEDFSDCTLGAGDLIFIPGIESRHFNDAIYIEQGRLTEWLRVQYDRGVKICAVCTGSFIVGRAGLLDHRQCTTHWAYLKRMKERFPRIQLQEDRFFVEDAGIYTTAGVSSGIDLALHLLEEQFGAEKAFEVARMAVIYLRRGKADPQLSPFLRYRNHINDQIHTVQNWIQDHLHLGPIKVEDLAEIVYMSPRNLSRRFKAITGVTIGGYIRENRVERALGMLKGGHKLREITTACGLNSEEQLRRIIKQQLGRLPGELKTN